MDVPQEQRNRNNPAKRNPISNDARAFSSCPNTTARYRLPKFLTSLRRRRAFSRNRITGLPATHTGPTAGTLEQGGSAFVTGQAGRVFAPASMPTWRTTAATWSCGPVVQASRCPCRIGNVGRPGVRDVIGGQAEIRRPSWRLADRVRHREGRPRTQEGKDSRRALQIRNPVIEGLAESETQTDPLPPVCHSLTWAPSWSRIDCLFSACGMRSAFRIPKADIFYGTEESLPARTHVRSRDAEKSLQ